MSLPPRQGGNSYQHVLASGPGLLVASTEKEEVKLSMSNFLRLMRARGTGEESLWSNGATQMLNESHKLPGPKGAGSKEVTTEAEPHSRGKTSCSPTVFSQAK